MNYDEFFNELMNLGNYTILDGYAKAINVLNQSTKAVCSISGGSDSDIMLDIIHRVDTDNKVKYVWFDTGIEYQATKDHLSELENKYNITIEKVKAVKPIPSCCKEYGQPFISKYVSQMIENLQHAHFKWQDKPYEELIEEYKGEKCKSGIGWWCNKAKVGNGFKETMFNINHNKLLKEFMIKNPPLFKISAKCCDYAKKKTALKCYADYDIDLDITGLRKNEGGCVP